MPTLTYAEAAARFKANVTPMLPEGQQADAFAFFETIYVNFDDVSLAINSRDFSTHLKQGVTDRSGGNYRAALDLALQIQDFVDSLPRYKGRAAQRRQTKDAAKLIKDAARK
jgi:hypothetical protein